MGMVIPASQSKEVAYLDELRTYYEAKGFVFLCEPQAEILPDFLKPYRLDAIAQKPGENIVIEVLSGSRNAAKMKQDAQSIGDIQKILASHPDWHLHVMRLGTATAIPGVKLSPVSLIKRRRQEILSLSEQGYYRPAFLMAWTLLEACWLARYPDRIDQGRTLGTILQILSMDGLITSDEELELRSFLSLRNRITHGDLEVEPTSEQISTIINICDSISTI